MIYIFVGHLQKFVEDYVGAAERDLTESDIRWNQERKIFLHKSLTILSFLKNLPSQQHLLTLVCFAYLLKKIKG